MLGDLDEIIVFPASLLLALQHGGWFSVGVVPCQASSVAGASVASESSCALPVFVLLLARMRPWLALLFNSFH